MRLSDVKGERTFEVIAELAQPVASIITDEAVRSCFKADSDTPTKVAAVLPLLMGEHRGDVVSILSAIEGVTPEEYVEKADLKSLVSDVYEIMTDEAFLDFLPSDETGGGSSTS